MITVIHIFYDSVFVDSSILVHLGTCNCVNYIIYAHIYVSKRLFDSSLNNLHPYSVRVNDLLQVALVLVS